MKKWWIGAALAAMCVGQSALAQGQPGGGVLPDPVPVAPCPPGQGNLDFMPGPMTGSTAPRGPENCLTLPADIPTAWGKGPMPEEAAFLHVGAMALTRQRPGSGTVAEINDTTPLTTHNIDPDLALGGRATFGYLYDSSAIELTGFYIPQQETSVPSVNLPGQFGLFFFNTPANFTGPTGAGLLTRADTVTLNLRNSLGDAELNYRWWSRSDTGPEGIIGFRYMNMVDRASITASSAQSGSALGINPYELQATYLSRANNNLLMAQAGFEWNLRMTCWLMFGVTAKGAVGADYVDVTTRVSNGFGLVGANAKSDAWTWSTVYELDAFFDIVQFEKVRLRVGYTALWLVRVAEGFQQVTYDLSAQPVVRSEGSIFYHGPMLELMFLF
jgi:hypothetical protein